MKSLNDDSIDIRLSFDKVSVTMSYKKETEDED